MMKVSVAQQIESEEATDETIVGVLELAGVLFADWTWACAVLSPTGPRILQARPLSEEEAVALQAWAAELLDASEGGLGSTIDAVLSERALASRAFVVPDPSGRDVALMGFGPLRAVEPESDVILEAVACNLGVFADSVLSVA
jgi:hypothetical protein